MEVNSSPGLNGIETATGKDISGMIIEYMENMDRASTATKGQG
jgi:ribosomal protein S6--L-glutamate ligase